MNKKRYNGSFFHTLIYIYNIYGFFTSFSNVIIILSISNCNNLWIRLNAVNQDEIYITDEEGELDITSSFLFRILIFSITVQNTRSNITVWVWVGGCMGVCVCINESLCTGLFIKEDNLFSVICNLPFVIITL